MMGFLFLVTSYPIGEEVNPDRFSPIGETLLDLWRSCYFAALQNLKVKPNNSALAKSKRRIYEIRVFSDVQ